MRGGRRGESAPADLGLIFYVRSRSKSAAVSATWSGSDCGATPNAERAARRRRRRRRSGRRRLTGPRFARSACSGRPASSRTNSARSPISTISPPESNTRSRSPSSGRGDANRERGRRPRCTTGTPGRVARICRRSPRLACRRRSPRAYSSRLGHVRPRDREHAGDHAARSGVAARGTQRELVEPLRGAVRVVEHVGHEPAGPVVDRAGRRVHETARFPGAEERQHAVGDDEVRSQELVGAHRRQAVARQEGEVQHEGAVDVAGTRVAQVAYADFACPSGAARPVPGSPRPRPAAGTSRRARTPACRARPCRASRSRPARRRVAGRRRDGR